MTDQGIDIAIEEMPDDLSIKAETYFVAATVKDMGDGKVGGILVPFGGERDAQGEFFYPDVELREHRYDGKLPILFHHGMSDIADEEIGVIETMTRTAQGLYVEGKLFLDHANARLREVIKRLYRDVKEGKLGWSSGSAPHLVDIDEQGGIKRWALIEGTLTYNPSAGRRTTAAAIRSANQEVFEQPATADKQLPIEDSTGDTADAPEEPLAKENRATDELPLKTKAKNQPRTRVKHKKGGMKMPDQSMLISALQDKGVDPETILGVLQDLGAAEETPDMPVDEMDNDLPVRSEDNDAPADNGQAPAKTNGGKTFTSSDVQDIIKAVNLAMRTKAAPNGDDVPAVQKPTTKANIQVKSKFDRLSWEDMAFVKTIMDASLQAQGKGSNWQPQHPERFYRELADKATKAGRTFDDEAAKALNAIKADEVNYSTQSGYGDEFVPEMWRAQLWETPRLENVVFANTTFIEMPSDPYRLPIEGSDPTVYAVSETTNEDTLALDISTSPIPDSKVATSNDTLNAAKLALRVMVSEELNEDSIIPVASHWRQKCVRTMEDARDNVILNADATTGSTNINNDGGSISAGTKVLYGGGDGFFHTPLVDATSQAVNMGGVAPTLTKIREMRGKLGRALMGDRANLRYFCDPETHLKLLSLDEAVVQSINGRGSTFNDGMIEAIDGIPLLVSNEIALSAADGKVDSTASNNTFGRLLLVHTGSWYGGFRRNIRVNFDYIPHYDIWMLVVTMRMALLRRATDTAAVLYNIKV